MIFGIYFDNTAPHTGLIYFLILIHQLLNLKDSKFDSLQLENIEEIL